MDYKEFSKMMKSTRNAYIKADQKTREVLSRISEELSGMELTEFKTFAENADNFEEAILCYKEINKQNYNIKTENQ